MRTIEEIKQDISVGKTLLDNAKADGDAGKIAFCEAGNERLRMQLIDAITADIPLDELETMCTAWKDKRCVVLPCKVGDTVNSAQYGKGEVVAWDTTARVKFAADVKLDWPYKDYDIGSKMFTHEAALKGASNAE